MSRENSEDAGVAGGADKSCELAGYVHSELVYGRACHSTRTPLSSGTPVEGSTRQDDEGEVFTALEAITVDRGTDQSPPVSKPSKVSRKVSRVSFSIPLNEPRARDGVEVASDSRLTQCERVRSVSQASQDLQYHRRRSTLATLAVERFLITRERRWSIAISSLVGSILMFLVGFTLAFPSNASLDLTGEATELPQDYFLPISLLSTFAALAPAGAVFSGPLSGWIADRWGRKSSMMFCGVPYLIGYLILSYAHFAPTAIAFKVLLFTGRFITGVGMGWASAVVPIYIAEISSVKLRGIFGTLIQIMFSAGIVLNYSIGTINGFRYYYTSLVAVGLVALFEVLMFWLPDTPRWLLSRGYGEEAENVLLWFRGKTIGIKKELDEMKASLTANKNTEKKVLKQFQKRSVFIPFVYVLIVFLFQQAGGINAVASFASTIFSEAGVSNPRLTSIYAVGCASLIGNFASFFLVDLVGRMSLLIASGTGMFLGSTILGTHFFITRPSLCNDFNATVIDTMENVAEPCNAHFGPLAIVSLILYRLSFAIGFGPMPWILISELLPLSVRGVASGFVMVTNWSMSALVAGLYLVYVAVVQQWFAMWTFALINLAAAVFVLLVLPETKGKSLEEMERKYEKRPDIVETVL